MRADAQYNSHGATNFFFSHRVAAVKLVLTFPQGVAGEATNIGLKATGLSHAAKLDLTEEDNGGEYYKDKQAGDVNIGTNAITIDPTSRTLIAYLCVLPEALSEVKVTATVGSDNYEAVMKDAKTLRAEMMYTVKKDMQKQWGTTFAFTINPSNGKYTLPFTANGSTGAYTLTVNWGDGASQTIDPNTSLSTPITHDYTTSGPCQITIKSSETDCTKTQMPEFKPGSRSDAAKLFSVDTPLLNMGITDLNNCFANCTKLSSIPKGLFDNNTTVTNFSYCFMTCRNLTSIPQGSFDKNAVATTFEGCFGECVSLTSIPAGLFDNNPIVTNFSYCFYSAGLTAIPAELFAKNKNAINFLYCFFLLSHTDAEC